MMKKTYSKTGSKCRVTFKLPSDVNAESAAITGEFTEWAPKNMKRLKDGSFSVTLSVEANSNYRYRFLLDGERWENDWAADGYVPNGYGQEDSVLEA